MVADINTLVCNFLVPLPAMAIENKHCSFLLNVKKLSPTKCVYKWCLVSSSGDFLSCVDDFDRTSGQLGG